MPTQKDTNAFSHIIAIIAVFVLGVALLVSISNRNGTHGPYNSSVEVSASGYASATPNQATVYLYVNGSGNTSQQAVSNLASTLGRLNSTLLKYVNGNASLIQTQSLSVYNYQPCIVPPCKNATPRYNAQEGIRVQLMNIDNTSPLVGAVSSIPSVIVNDVSVGVSSSEGTSLRNAALEIAIQNATSQASVIAGAGTQLTLVDVNIDNYYAYPSLTFGSGVANVQSTYSNPVFYSGKYQVSETVTAVFEYTK